MTLDGENNYNSYIDADVCKYISMQGLEERGACSLPARSVQKASTPFDRSRRRPESDMGYSTGSVNDLLDRSVRPRIRRGPVPCNQSLSSLN